MSFFPETATVPAGLETEEFVLRPLRTTDVALDHAALMVSKEMLRRWGRNTWPTDDFSLAENWEDLKKHEDEHLAREAFTFTVMDPTASECLGCVYLTPLPRLLRWAKVDEEEVAAVKADEASVRFWAIEPRLADDLDKRLFIALVGWLKRDWPFSRLLFRTTDLDTRQQALFAEASLPLRYILKLPNREGEYILYGE